MTRLTSYIVGYALSVALTLLPLVLVWLHAQFNHARLSHETLLAAFVASALMQLGVQLYFFLHMGEEQKPRLNLFVLGLALLIAAIVVGGTLWIMHDLSVGHALPFDGAVISPQTEH